MISFVYSSKEGLRRHQEKPRLRVKATTDNLIRAADGPRGQGHQTLIPHWQPSTEPIRAMSIGTRTVMNTTMKRKAGTKTKMANGNKTQLMLNTTKNITDSFTNNKA